jgi:hypothetical protein
MSGWRIGEEAETERLRAMRLSSKEGRIGEKARGVTGLPAL